MRTVLLAAALAALVTLCGLGGGVAAADCSTTGGSGCLPGSGYTLDTVWNCGGIYRETDCYANGTTEAANAVRHTFGWGSASFPGTTVCIHLGASTYSCAWELARVCWQANCNDQDTTAVRAWVLQLAFNVAWRVSGHAQA